MDRLTHLFLLECLENDILAAREKFLAAPGIPADEVESVVKEVELLARNGLFDIPDYRLSPEDAEKAFRERYKKPITSISMGMAESCNLACTYCYCGQQRDSSNRLMTVETAKAVVDWLFRNSGDEKKLSITFFGGEPTLNKPAIRFVAEYATKLAEESGKGISFSMTSNVTLVDDEFAEFLKKYKVGVLVSFDGPEEVHGKQRLTRDGKSSFTAAAAGAKRVLGIQKNVTARCTLTRPPASVKDLADFFADFGFSSCFLGPVTNCEEHVTPYDFNEDDYLDFNRQNEALIPGILEKVMRGEALVYDPFGRFADKYKSRAKSVYVSNCGAASSGCLYVNVDGGIYPCHHFFGMEAWKVGDIRTGDPVKAELLEKYWRDFREATAACESCWAGCVCQGPCSADLMRSDGTFSENIRHCDSRRFVLERAGYYYHKKNVQKKIETPATEEPCA